MMISGNVRRAVSWCASRACVRTKMSAVNEDMTHFGFKNVTKEEKAKNVNEVFTAVANKYDIMNDVMSAGVHRLWKDEFVRMLSPVPGMKILDVAGGTGDISFRILDQLRQFDGHDTGAQSINYNTEFEVMDLEAGNRSNLDESYKAADVVVFDINADMLRVGEERASKLGDSQRLAWVQGDAMNLPFPDQTFDAYTIAFGIRNVVEIDKALKEAFRVLKPGGRFLCLEFSNVNNPLLRWLYNQYSFQMIPVMGQIVAGDWQSYQYLVESIRKFPNQETFMDMIRKSGFRLASYKNFLSGVCSIHTGFKL